MKDKAPGEERELHARYVVIADGSLSRFGRALGNQRDKRLPQGMAIRGYFESPLHAEPWIESALDVRDRNGDAMPGYGWIFPCGDGTINVGIGLLSTFRGWRDINTSHLMHEWAATAPAHWGIDPDAMLGEPTGGRLPMAGSVNPKSGPTWIAIGDAAGSINPFNGEGIDYAYETGRMAAELIDEALETGSAMPLARYPDLLEAEYGLYFRVARAFAHVIGQPALMQQLTRVGMQSPVAHGVGAADHGQPAPPRRARPRRGRLPGGRQDRQHRPRARPRVGVRARLAPPSRAGLGASGERSAVARCPGRCRPRGW